MDALSTIYGTRKPGHPVRPSGAGSGMGSNARPLPGEDVTAEGTHHRSGNSAALADQADLSLPLCAEVREPCGVVRGTARHAGARSRTTDPTCSPDRRRRCGSPDVIGSWIDKSDCPCTGCRLPSNALSSPRNTRELSHQACVGKG